MIGQIRLKIDIVMRFRIIGNTRIYFKGSIYLTHWRRATVHSAQWRGCCYLPHGIFGGTSIHDLKSGGAWSANTTRLVMFIFFGRRFAYNQKLIRGKLSVSFTFMPKHKNTCLKLMHAQKTPVYIYICMYVYIYIYIYIYTHTHKNNF